MGHHVTIRKMSGNLLYAPRIYIYIYIYVEREMREGSKLYLTCLHEAFSIRGVLIYLLMT